MTPEELRQLCEKWQKRLRLQDWHVGISYKRAHEMDVFGSEGCIDVNEEHRWAKIDILNPNDDWPNRFVPRDTEFTVVHELIHIHFAPLNIEGHNKAEEQAINALTEAILGRKRGEV